MKDNAMHSLDMFIRQTLAAKNIPELYNNSLSGICKTLRCDHGIILSGSCDHNSLKINASHPHSKQYTTSDIKEIFDCFAPNSKIPDIDIISIKTFDDLALRTLPKIISNLGMRTAYSITTRWSTNEYLFIAVYSDQQNLTNEVNIEFLTIAAKILLVVIKQLSHTADKAANYRSALQAKHEWVATVDALDDIICTVDINFNILRANRAVESWGLGTVDNISGKCIHEVIHSNCTSESCELTTCLNDIQSSLNKANYLCTNTFDPRSRKNLKISARTINSPGNATDSYITNNSFAVVIIQDITDQEFATKLMLKFNKRLASEVRERTTELTKVNQQLNRLTQQIFNAQEKERRHIALELHDGVGQSLTAIKYYAEELIESSKKSTDKSQINKLQNIVDKVKSTVDEIRNISMNLRPSILDDLGLGATISWFYREFNKMHSTITVYTEIDVDEKNMSDLLATTIYRITQEATNNIVKHANATSINYRLIGSDGFVVLTIADNGIGIKLSNDCNPEGRNGMGIASMIERATLTGGKIEFDSPDTGGLLVRGEWEIV